ncbi:hypothetical protein D0810_15060 [Vibrio cholerae]|nr:hypothetical protein [Vibrio cholerae]EGR2283079.1 hypothetical protein [Vibrio cholerae]
MKNKAAIERHTRNTIDTSARGRVGQNLPTPTELTAPSSQFSQPRKIKFKSADFSCRFLARFSRSHHLWITFEIFMDTELAKKMIARADADNLHQDHEMRVLAAKFEFAATNLDREDGAKKMLGCWARAKRCWSNYTGEPLI